MQLDFLPHGSPDCPLIRLFDFTPNEARQLEELVSDLATGRVRSVALHELNWLIAAGEIELTFRTQGWDQDIIKIGPNAFECGLTTVTWENVAGLIEPFTESSDGCQWLSSGPGEAKLLFSVSGQW